MPKSGMKQMKLCPPVPHRLLLVILVTLLGSSGCTAFLAPRDPFPATPPEPPLESTVPRELDKVTLPRYVIEPPDILLIEGVKLVPKSPHTVEAYNGMVKCVAGAFPVGPPGRWK